MEAPEHQKSRVVVVDSLQSWEFYVTQATNQKCPIVVHFTASWCIPSMAMNPTFEEPASSYPDVLFLTADVDEVKEVAARLKIKAMPTFLLLKDCAPGGEAHRREPRRDKEKGRWICSVHLCVISIV